MSCRWLVGLLCLVGLALAVFALAEEQRGPFRAPTRSVRSRDFDGQHLRLELRVNLEQQTLGGTATWTITPLRPLRQVELDAAHLKVGRVVLVDRQDPARNRPLKCETLPERLRIELGEEYRPEQTLVLAVDYSIERPEHGAHFVVPDENEPRAQRMMWTQGEPEYAHYWFPCFDSPADRITSETLITAARPLLVLSNGALEKSTDNPDGTRTWHWSQKDSHVAYLVSVVVGEFEALEQQWDGLPVVSYVPKGRLADAERSFAKTPAMVKFFSEKIGVRYPWPKYAQICVDEYQWGGMEHTSATTLNVGTLHDERAHLDVSSDNLVAHELAHQWWGDLLTCKDWGELWLNESFATYFANLWTEHDRGADEAAWERYGEAQHYFNEDQHLYRRSIVNYRYDAAHHMFDSHTYPKGGRVLHMLRFVLGDDAFWRAIRLYAQRNRFRTVEAADLRIAIEEATGQGLGWFFDQWLYQGGHPEYTVTWTWNDQAKSVRLTVRQTQKRDSITPLFRMPVEIELAGPKGVRIERIEVSAAEEQFTFPMEERPSRVCFDPRDWILKQLKFDKSKEELLDQLASDPHAMCRLAAAQQLGQFAPDDDAREALLRAARSDSFWPLREQAAKTLAGFTGDGVRAGLAELARRDPKSQVRRRAIESLQKFPHESTAQALREIVAQDASYFAAAAALAALVKVDRQHAADDLLAALARPSHDEVILKAACDGLAELKHAQALPKALAELAGPVSPQRIVPLVALATRLAPAEPSHLERLKKLLDSRRMNVRRSAIEALAEVGDERAVDLLTAARAKEEKRRMIQALDAALDKLRVKQRDLEQLRSQLEELRRENRRLDDRIKKLEESLRK